jgi:RNA polymerase sigma factor (sigma-70 family)
VNREEFGDFVNKHSQKLRAEASKRINRDDAEDAVQEAVIEMLEKWDAFAHMRDEELLGCVITKVKDHGTKLRRQLHADRLVFTGSEDEREETDYDSRPSRADIKKYEHWIHEEFKEFEEGRDVKKALSSLRRDERTIVEGYFGLTGEEMKYRPLEKRLGIPRSTLQRKMNDKAFPKLRKSLAGYEEQYGQRDDAAAWAEAVISILLGRAKHGRAKRK